MVKFKVILFVDFSGHNEWFLATGNHSHLQLRHYLDPSLSCQQNGKFVTLAQQNIATFPSRCI